MALGAVMVIEPIPFGPAGVAVVNAIDVIGSGERIAVA